MSVSSNNLIARKYFPGLSCTAFEPTPETYKHLSKNIKNNPGPGNIEVMCLAVSSGHGDLVSGDFGNCSGKNAILATSIHSEKDIKKRVSVKTSSLDDLYSCEQGRIIVKVDTEGHEINVIKGGQNFFNFNQIVLQIETGHKDNTDELDNLIRSYNLSLLFSLGPDSYYTNIPELLDHSNPNKILEKANEFVIAHRWNIDRKVYLTIYSGEGPLLSSISENDQGKFLINVIFD